MYNCIYRRFGQVSRTKMQTYRESVKGHPQVSGYSNKENSNTGSRYQQNASSIGSVCINSEETGLINRTKSLVGTLEYMVSNF